MAGWNDAHARMILDADCRHIWQVRMLRTLWEADEVRAYALVEALLERRKAARLHIGGDPIVMSVPEFYKALLNGTAPG